MRKVLYVINSIAFLLLLIAGLNPANAQSAASEATLIMPAKSETVASIMEQQRLAPPQAFRDRPEKEGPDREHLRQNPLAPKIAGFPATTAVTAPAATNLTASLTFNGVTGPTETGAFPPDDMGAVGPTQYVVFVNGRLRTFNKATGVADGVLNANPDVFFSSVMTPLGGGVLQVFTSDPRIRFDRISARWLLIIIDVPCTNSSCSQTAANRCLIAVSNTSTITAATTWTFSQFTGQAGKFLDYPTLGIDKNGIYIGGNMFSLAGSFVGTNGYVINRTNVMANLPYTVYTFADLAAGAGAGPYTPQGVDNFDAAPTEGYFVGVDNATYGTLMLRRVSTPATVPTISANIPLSVAATAAPQTVPHLGNTGGTNGKLDALDDRLYAAMIRNGSLWTAHNISVNTTGVAASSGTIRRNGVRWYQLQNLDGVPTLNQSGTIFDPNATATSARWYSIPSIMVSGQGHAIFGMTTAGVERANSAAATRFSSDASGTTQSPILLTTSSTAYNPAGDPGGAGGRRWGDYSYVSLDPLDDMTMWCINQYCVGTNVYGCGVTKLLAPVPATPAVCVPPTTASGQTSVNVLLTGTAVSGSGFYDPGSNLAAPALPFNHISATVTGGVTVNSITYTSPTSITLNVNTTGASAGLQSITVTNPDGQVKSSVGGILTVTSVPTAPEIDITGNGVSIADGDVTPSLTDHTDFGDVTTGNNLVRTYTVTNSGTANLTVSSIAVSGPDMGLFTLGALTPASPIAPAGSATFTVTFAPTTPGLKTATITVNNNDADESVYDFAIQGNAVGAEAPEIDITGNGISIVDGDMTPTFADNTDVGNTVIGGSHTQNFDINNLGTGPLTVSSIVVSGANAGLFTASGISPAGPIAPGGTASFTVTFAPTTTGIKTATITVNNDDADEGVYDFAMQGNGYTEGGGQCDPVTTILFVNKSNTNPGNGSSWNCALNELSDAITIANADPGITSIWVAAGTYTPTNGTDRTAVMATTRADLQILGGFAGGEVNATDADPVANPTIISGDIGVPGDMSDNSYRLFNIGGSPVSSSALVIDGFIFEKGNADAPGDGDHSVGAALLSYGIPAATPVQIKRCIFRNNF
ncbi:MAG: choice-of-anchor D domain-containing protein, partial [Chitinophagaceae bacterium]